MSEMKGSIVGTSEAVSLIIPKLVMVSAADYEVRFWGLLIRKADFLLATEVDEPSERIGLSAIHASVQVRDARSFTLS